MQNVKMWTDGVPVEPDALTQIRNIASLPILAGHVAVMPDVHLGKGATVGSVIPTRGAIIPAAVGVDIGCGMLAAETNLAAADLPDSLSRIRSAIEAAVPVGFNMHPEPVRSFHDGLQGIALHRRMTALGERYDRLRIMGRLRTYDHGRVWRQCASLGGGNHFIEIALSDTGRVWLMLHSGSRNVGKTIGEVAIGIARERAQRLALRIPDRDLAWLEEGSAEFEEYVEALGWAQEYAALNRDLMLHRVLKAVNACMDGRVEIVGEVVNCHHNYASLEAGRRMSRGAAKRQFTLEDLAAQTAGVECRKDEGVIDEIPGAYKDIDAVMAAQRDLVETVHTLKQVLCVKG